MPCILNLFMCEWYEYVEHIFLEVTAASISFHFKFKLRELLLNKLEDSIIGVTRNTINITLAYRLRSCMVCYKQLCLTSAYCLLNMIHQIQDFFSVPWLWKWQGFGHGVDNFSRSTPLPHTNKLYYHYGNVYISVIIKTFCCFRGFSQFVESI
jgi:hypothetical protein